MKVIDAYIKCSKCEELYHKSCHRQLIARGKKMITINDNIMLCEEHCRKIHSIVETFHNALKGSKNEIIALKSKNVETIQTNNDIKNELELLQLQYTRLESSSERKIKILMDEVTALKLENDSYRRGNCELNKNLELAQARIEDPKNEVAMENAITLLKEELSTNILSLKKELNSSINNKFIELQENLIFHSRLQTNHIVKSLKDLKM